ncbi:hypothetical protein AB0911_25830 [Streptomyces nigra]|uniref:hypothetical protein n=1 Tax=Streptomyces nigra TaxID=1827580 RepID=UPI003451F6B9
MGRRTPDAALLDDVHHTSTPEIARFTQTRLDFLDDEHHLQFGMMLIIQMRHETPRDAQRHPETSKVIQ